RVPSDVIARPRLTALIRDGLAGPLTLVCAPAGFGKTVALATAVEGVRWPVAWLSLTAGDSSLTRYVRYFVAAIQRCYPDTCHSTLSLLELPELPSPTAIARALEEDVDALPDDCVVVLDDYHMIDCADVDRLLGEQLQRLPPQLHLAVASRTQPAWPLASLRAAGLLVEVGADALRFTPAETRAFLRRAMRDLADDPTTTTVHQQMAGWAAGVRLAAITLQQPTSAPETPHSIGRRVALHAIEYLLDEIVTKQPPHVANFLVQTSICDRVSPALADALLAGADYPPDTAALLPQLERAGLFVAREGVAGVWYRYHDLLRAAPERRPPQHYDPAHIRTPPSRATAPVAPPR